MATQDASASVVAVSAARGHVFSKRPQLAIRLVAGLGVAGDAHSGATVRHRSRVARDPTAPNLRQVHLIGAELFAELAGRGFSVGPAELGENITTRDLALLALPSGTRLAIGAEAVIEVTGLRNPCVQLDRFHPGLMKAVLDRDPDGRLVRKAGVMAVVLRSGDVTAGDAILVERPPGLPRPLDVV